MPPFPNLSVNYCRRLKFCQDPYHIVVDLISIPSSSGILDTASRPEHLRPHVAVVDTGWCRCYSTVSHSASFLYLYYRHISINCLVVPFNTYFSLFTHVCCTTLLFFTKHCTSWSSLYSCTTLLRYYRVKNGQRPTDQLQGRRAQAREDAGLARPSSSAQGASPIRGKKAESEALGLPPCAAAVPRLTSPSPGRLDQRRVEAAQANRDPRGGAATCRRSRAGSLPGSVPVQILASSVRFAKVNHGK